MELRRWGVLAVGLWVALLVAGCAGREVAPAGGPLRTEPGKRFIFPLIMVGASEIGPAVVLPTPQPALSKVAGVAWPHEDGRNRALDLAGVGAGVTLDWSYDQERAAAAEAVGVRYLPMQWGCRNGARSVRTDAVAFFARKHPGATWLAFNEPDHGGQANCTPAQAAEAYWALREALAAVDPRARVYCCGTAWPAGHIEWTAAFGEAYRERYGTWPAVDGLHVHSYTHVWEDRFNYLARQTELLAVRSWANGQPWLAGKPMIVSEWGVLSSSWWSEDAGRIAREYLPAMRRWFQAQGWIVADVWFASWYSDTMYQPSNVWERETGRLTAVGEAWRRAR